MTDRDTFAAAALTGLLANEDLLADDDKVAETAYELADAMLRERGNHSEKPNSSPTLTAEERADIDTAAASYSGIGEPVYERIAATLRKLLERLHK